MTGDGSVLIVDDEPLVLRSTERLLARLGYRVRTAADAPAALAALDDADPSVILLDLHLGDLPGDVLLEAIATRRPALVERCIVCSGDLGSAAALAAIARTGAPGLAKPYGIDDLVARLAPRCRGRAPAHVA